MHPDIGSHPADQASTDFFFAGSETPVAKPGVGLSQSARRASRLLA
jgi:hypothetical protein